jgi:membrane protein implicated in regulation of membrane protease activity
MESLLQALAGFAYWHWLALGLGLLLVELLTGSTYLLWPAVAAWLTGLAAMIAPMPFTAELMIFAVAVVLLLVFARPLFSNRLLAGPDTGLNDPGRQLAGAQGVAVADFAHGEGRVRLGDTEWRAESEEPIIAEDGVEVLGVSGASLKVRRRGGGEAEK